MGTTYVSQHRPTFRHPSGQGCRAVAGPPAKRPALASVVLAALALAGCATGMGQSAPAPAAAAAESLDQLRERADMALQTGRTAQAKQLYAAILAREADDPEALSGLGEAEVLLGEYGPALDHSRQAAEGESK